MQHPVSEAFLQSSFLSYSVLSSQFIVLITQHTLLSSCCLFPFTYLLRLEREKELAVHGGSSSEHMTSDMPFSACLTFPFSYCGSAEFSARDLLTTLSLLGRLQFASPQERKSLIHGPLSLSLSPYDFTLCFLLRGVDRICSPTFGMLPKNIIINMPLTARGRISTLSGIALIARYFLRTQRENLMKEVKKVAGSKIYNIVPLCV